MITGKNKIKCGLIGEKLSHSFSPMIHNLLADYSYKLFEVAQEDLENFIKGDSFDCANVTIPYKKTVMQYLDEISDEAKRIGSVNTVKKCDGKLFGYNTDYFGFLYLLEKGKISVNGKNVLILGTGGASLTAKTVCSDLGARKITFVSRGGQINYENCYSRCADTEIIVNCTPVGMYPKNGESPIDLCKFKNCCGVVDIVYNPAKTKLLLDAEKLGIRNIGGLYMLVAQAKKACEIFLDCKIHDSEIDRITKIIQANAQNVILIGMPGCGKTTISKILAQKLAKEVIDTDEKIIDKAGVSIPEIFAEQGEEAFRRLEHSIIDECGKLSQKIISTGGGVVTREENYAPLRQNGVIFFINRNISSLDTSGRPLSQAGKLQDMYEKRLPMYKRFCDFEVDNNSTPEDCANKIIEILGDI